MDATRLVQWATFVPLAAFFAIGSIGNWIALGLILKDKLLDSRRGGRSTFPIVPGAAGVIACLVTPISGLRACFWVPMLIDWTFVLTPVWLVWRGSRYLARR